MAGVKWSGGAITRMRVADKNERAKGTRWTLCSSLKDVELAGDRGLADLEFGEVAGVEKTMARRSSLSLP